MVFEFFVSKGVGSHPSDLEMKEIANKIFSVFILSNRQN